MNYTEGIHRLKNKFSKKKSVRKLSSSEAYGIWHVFYDDQPDNVVLYLDEKLFSEMLVNAEIANKNILDIGSGTGRHWKELLEHKPLKITGIDSSIEMTEKLKAKFKDAEVIVTDTVPSDIIDSSIDLIISTLTIGHIKDVHDHFKEWDRLLKKGGEVIITDFHPGAFSSGMKRSFPFNNEVIEVENYLYDLKFLASVFTKLNWKIISTQEKIIDESVKHFFEKQNFIKAYNKYFGTPLILGMHLKKK